MLQFRGVILALMKVSGLATTSFTVVYQILGNHHVEFLGTHEDAEELDDPDYVTEGETSADDSMILSASEAEDEELDANELKASGISLGLHKMFLEEFAINIHGRISQGIYELLKVTLGPVMSYHYALQPFQGWPLIGRVACGRLTTLLDTQAIRL
jgi:hypothetical protein